MPTTTKTVAVSPFKKALNQLAPETDATVDSLLQSERASITQQRWRLGAVQEVYAIHERTPVDEMTGSEIRDLRIALIEIATRGLVPGRHAFVQAYRNAKTQRLDIKVQYHYSGALLYLRNKGFRDYAPQIVYEGDDLHISREWSNGRYCVNFRLSPAGIEHRGEPCAVVLPFLYPDGQFEVLHLDRAYLAAVKAMATKGGQRQNAWTGPAETQLEMWKKTAQHRLMKLATDNLDVQGAPVPVEMDADMPEVVDAVPVDEDGLTAEERADEARAAAHGAPVPADAAGNPVGAAPKKRGRPRKAAVAEAPAQPPAPEPEPEPEPEPAEAAGDETGSAGDGEETGDSDDALDNFFS